MTPLQRDLAIMRQITAGEKTAFAVLYAQMRKGRANRAVTGAPGRSHGEKIALVLLFARQRQSRQPEQGGHSLPESLRNEVARIAERDHADSTQYALAS